MPDATRGGAAQDEPVQPGAPATGAAVRPAVAQSRTRAWVLLLLAAAFEIVFALSTGATDGFTVLWPSMIAVVAVAGSIYFLTQALRTLDVGVGYTVWTGIGSAGTVVLGALVFDESLGLAKIACFVLIIGGVIGLQQSDRTPKTATSASEAVSVAVRCGGTAALPDTTAGRR